MPRLPAVALSLLLLPLPLLSVAQDMEALLQMDIDELMNLRVVTANRHEQEVWKAPAIITVLEGEDIRRRGYRSLGEALTNVPGLHVIQDGVGFYVVARGVGSGQRSYARTFKVMLDGQPLGMRSDASQFLGPELIPLGAVDRVEVVRGPASALYGADAYLGVINIITRPSPPSLRVQVGIGQQETADPSASAEVLVSEQGGAWQGLVTASVAREDRSGRELPSSSPLRESFDDTTSRDDFNRPVSLYARLQNEQEQSRHVLALHVSELDSMAEFLDFGTLSHDNRISLLQQTLAWSSEWRPAAGQHYQLRLAHAEGGPATSEHLSLGETASRPEREFGYQAWDAGLEAQLSWASHHVVAGVDGSWDNEEPFEVYNINESTGTRMQLSPDQKDRLFRNEGFYLQYQWQPVDWSWVLALNWRHDSHNRYGDHDSYRVGLTGELRENLHGKLLYGTSFKAPNAFQLYAQPLYVGDILGNTDLEPETARTVEGQLNWQARSNLMLSLTAYHLQVRKLIELQPFGFNHRWLNRGEQNGHGVETELRWQHGVHHVGFASAWQDTIVRLEQPLVPVVEVQTASAPRLITRADWRYVVDEMELGIEGRHVSERRASDSNIDINLREVYTLPSYTLWRVHGLRQYGDHRVGLSVDNLFDKDYAEPGYGGVDLPGQRRSVWLSWSWQQ